MQSYSVTTNTSTALVIKKFDALTSITPEDQTNLSTTHRSLAHYDIHLGLQNDLNKNLKSAIKKLAETTGRKVRLLDVGCGKATAITDLLSDKSLEPYLESVTGISMHHFKNIKKVIAAHKGRFIFALGQAQDILMHFANSFDLIVDIWGAFQYSDDKVGLLRRYYQALKPQGKAEIYAHRMDSMLFLHNQKEKALLPWILKKYPNTFSARIFALKTTDRISPRTTAITMTKNDEDFPLPSLKLKDAIKRRAPGLESYPRSDAEIAKGNSMYFRWVIYHEFPISPTTSPSPPPEPASPLTQPRAVNNTSSSYLGSVSAPTSHTPIFFVNSPKQQRFPFASVSPEPFLPPPSGSSPIKYAPEEDNSSKPSQSVKQTSKRGCMVQ
jgi:SAM-dependent methyltransferase